MRKIKIFLSVIVSLFLAGCTLNNSGESKQWSNAVQDEMKDCFGAVIPYAEFDSATFYHGVVPTDIGTITSGLYQIGDRSANNNPFSNYAAKLADDDFVEINEKIGDLTVYAKEVNNVTIKLTFEHKDKTDILKGGNTISVYFPYTYDGEEWSPEVVGLMMEYLGEVLPYAELNPDTMYAEYDDYYEDSGIGGLVIGDDSEVNVLSDYGDKLVAAGYVKGLDDYNDECYTKGEITVYYGYYETTDEYEAGNEIDVYFPLSEGGEEEFVVDVEYLLSIGCEEYNGWPTELVNAALDGTNITINPVNESGKWYAFCVEDEAFFEEGTYMFFYGATEGSYSKPLIDNLLEQGFEFFEELDIYSFGDFDVQSSVVEKDGFTIFQIVGPTILPPVTEEYLLSSGYEKVTGWPTDKVAEVLSGVVQIEGVCLDKEWFVASGIDDTFEPGYPYICLAINEDCVEAFITNLTAAGLTYGEDYPCYSDSQELIEVYLELRDGFTLIEIDGPYLSEGTRPEAELTDNYFTKVTSMDQLVDGKYILVYESESVALDGWLGDEIDASENTLPLAINDDGSISSNTLLETALVTIDVKEGTIMLDDSGLYIGNSSNSNKLETSDQPFTHTFSFDEQGNFDVAVESGPHLRYNPSFGFRYYKSSTYTNQKPIQLYQFVEVNEA